MSIATSIQMQQAFTSAAVQELALITNPRVLHDASTPAAAALAAPAFDAATKPVPPPQLRSVRSLLLNTPLSAFTAPEKGVLALNANVTAADGFKQLLARGVQSAPVMPVPVEAPPAGQPLQPLGFFELSDAVRYVVDAYDRAEAIAVVSRAYDGKLNAAAHALTHKPKPKPTETADAKAAAATSAQHQSVNEAIDQLFADARTGAAGTGANATVGQLCVRHPYTSLSRRASLLDAAALLVGTAHRVCVVDDKGFIANVLSQSDVVRFVYNNLRHVVSDELERSVDDWHMGARPVRAMETSARAIDVFRRMCDQQLTAVVLTDERGSYADLAQPSDLKLFLSLFATPNPQAPVLLSSAQFEAPISAVLHDLRQMELQKRIVKGSGSARLPLTVSTAFAPSFRDVVTRLATSRSHVLCLTSRLDDSAITDADNKLAAESAHPLLVPVMMCSLGDVLRAVLRWVPPTAAEAAELKRTRALERAAKAAEAAKAAAEAAAEADLAEAAAAAAAADAAAPPTPSPTPVARPKAAAAPSAADVKHSTPEAAKAALHTSATALAAAAQSLSAALQPNAGAQLPLPALMASVHSAYAAVASASPVAGPKQLPPAAPPKAGPAVPVEPKPAQGVAYAQHSSASGRGGAYNACAHDGVAHWYTDHGQCLYATHTCARLHPNPPACTWPDGAKFCAWDLGYAAGERIAHEAHTAATKRARDTSNTRTAVDAQLHAAATAAKY
eukprot:gnl/Spiro4/29804_TR14646_c0_g1_i1.p1 gnl/Spiro4/29804_TR14646_c0_g1~~gnl/Spiro4/29804_TR14646_c0_g1_i1.p1  ORF type:complete len:731 (-),score=293.71 gnl/Spiro4/29804_TR14646_c0_g1_i1:150-2342(-)